MKSREIAMMGLWAFAIVSLVGGLYGRLDGFWILVTFIVAVVMSVGLIVLPVSRAE